MTNNINYNKFSHNTLFSEHIFPNLAGTQVLQAFKYTTYELCATIYLIYSKIHFLHNQSKHNYSTSTVTIM